MATTLPAKPHACQYCSNIMLDFSLLRKQTNILKIARQLPQKWITSSQEEVEPYASLDLHDCTSDILVGYGDKGCLFAKTLLGGCQENTFLGLFLLDSSSERGFQISRAAVLAQLASDEYSVGSKNHLLELINSTGKLKPKRFRSPNGVCRGTAI
jgi:hypothetical protein